MTKDLAPQRVARPHGLWDWIDGPELNRWFGGMRPWFGEDDRLRLEEELTDDTLVIRAEMPGIDPGKDVEITVDNGVMRVHAERKLETKEEKEGRTRTEFRYGSFERAVRVPRGIGADDVNATYKDGILEVRLPCKVATDAPPRKVTVTRA